MILKAQGSKGSELRGKKDSEIQICLRPNEKIVASGSPKFWCIVPRVFLQPFIVLPNTAIDPCAKMSSLKTRKNPQDCTCGACKSILYRNCEVKLCSAILPVTTIHAHYARTSQHELKDARNNTDLIPTTEFAYHQSIIAKLIRLRNQVLLCGQSFKMGFRERNGSIASPFAKAHRIETEFA